MAIIKFRDDIDIDEVLLNMASPMLNYMTETEDTYHFLKDGDILDINKKTRVITTDFLDKYSAGLPTFLNRLFFKHFIYIKDDGEYNDATICDE